MLSMNPYTVEIMEPLVHLFSSSLSLDSNQGVFIKE